MEEWKEYRLGDIIKISSGFTYKGEYLGYGDKYLLGMGCVSFNEQFLDKGVRPYSGECDNRFYAKAGDIVLATRQQSDNMPILGMPAVIPYKYKDRKLIVGANLYRIINVSKDFGNDFIYWLLKDPRYVNYIKSCQSGTTVRMITKANIENYTFVCPNKKSRLLISRFLWTLEKKIELNRRINENLEQQAQALFKSWFVNFEPFKDGQFVDSELGKIPEGWKVGNLEELVEVKYGKDHKKLTSGTIPVYGSGGIMRYVDQYLYNKESVLIPRKGSLNNVMYINRPFWTVDTMFYTCMKIEGIAKFIYLFMSPKDLLSMNSGSAVPSMTVDILNKIQIITPPINILQKFECIMKPIFTKMDLCSYENQKLSQLRNTLLPRLMSGKLEIKDNSYD